MLATLKEFGSRNASRMKFPVLFGPGLFFLALGAVVILAPRLVLAVLAGFLLFIGFSLCYFAWRIIQLRHRFEGALKDLQGRVQIQAIQVAQPYEAEEDDFEPRKIIIH